VYPLRRLHNEDLHDLYSRPSITRMVKSRRMIGLDIWLVNINMDLSEIKWGCMDWINMAQDKDWWMARVNTVMNIHFL
jgi:hypothetical protein